MRPDPKRARRVVDAQAMQRARLREDECGSCGRRGANAHHILAKGSPHFGDDVLENLIVLCGSGSMGCHGALHGAPYIDGKGKRWDGAEVRVALGRAFFSRRRDIISYVLGKLGHEPGARHLERYGLTSAEIEEALA